MKKFVRVQQIYTVELIMDVAENEPNESVVKRIDEYCDNAGGKDVVICCGGRITAQVQEDRLPTEEDEESYGVVD